MPDQSEINTKAEEIISVCIATYKRERLLENLLISLNKQELPEKVKLEVVVTDNDAAASAESILRKFISTNRICYKYLVEPEKNISLARNKCLANATGKFICFIDDDETASESWVNNLYATLTIYEADGVFGYVQPVFDKNIPRHFRNREFYFSPVGETGTQALFYFTTNAIIKSDLIKSEKSPFNPDYGLTGGEDSHLFDRLARRGAIFRVCREAVTYENIPFERGNYFYLFNRALRGGQAFARRNIEFNQRLYYKASIFNKAFIIILINLIIFPIMIFNSKMRIKCIQKLGASIGKLRGLIGMLKISH